MKRRFFFGLFVTIFVIPLFLLLQKYEGNNLDYSYFLIPVLFICLAVWFRKKANAGILNFREGIGLSFSIAFYTALLFACFLLVYYKYISPGAIQLLQDRYSAALIPSEQVMVFDVAVQFAGVIVLGAFSGSVFSLLIGKDLKQA